MKDNRTPRLSYEESCAVLQRLGYPDAGKPGEIPPLPGRPPQFDDEESLGVMFFRTFVGEGDLENLTLPRTYFARSEIGPVSLRNTDLTESYLCWNDFHEVNFSQADLSRCDLRCSQFVKTRFVQSKLCEADLRRSSFVNCDFTNANLRGAKLTRKQSQGLRLSQEQIKSIAWQQDDGEEPPGG